MGNQKNKDKRFDKSYIESKDILNTSWLYFQQHAQQRISYFNFFVKSDGQGAKAGLTRGDFLKKGKIFNKTTC